jgi:hypothetical protein
MENGHCVSSKPPTCGEGTAFDGKRCVIGTKMECFNMEVCPPVGAASLPAP